MTPPKKTYEDIPTASDKDLSETPEEKLPGFREGSSGNLEESYNVIIKRYSNLYDGLKETKKEIDDSKKKIKAHEKEISAQKGYIILGFIILLVMVAQMLIDIFGMKLQSIGSLTEQINQQNIEFIKLNSKLDSLLNFPIQQRNENQQNSIPTTP